MNKLRIGIAQVNTKDNIDESFRTIERLTAEIAARGGDLAVFPEMSTYLSELDISPAAQCLEGEVISRFRELAKKYGIHLHNGSFVEKPKEEVGPKGKETGMDAGKPVSATGAKAGAVGTTAGAAGTKAGAVGTKADAAGTNAGATGESGSISKAFNTSVFINPEGEIEAVYRKIHLFDIELSGDLAYRESDRFLQGQKVVNHRNRLGDFGLTVCYDLRFPELYRSLALRGAKIIFVPSAFTLFTGKDHWEPLLRARAIENQVYIVAPNQIGEHPAEKKCYGNSMIVDPWGKVIARASDRVEAVVTDIDIDYVDEVRGKLPSLNNRVELENLE